MDQQLRGLERQLEIDPSFASHQAFANAVLRSQDSHLLFKLLSLVTPSRLLANGFLLIRVARRHVVVSPGFVFYHIDPRITQAMAGFAFENISDDPIFEPLFQVIGTDYSLELNDNSLDGTILWRNDSLDVLQEGNTHPWTELLDPLTRSKLVDSIIEISHLHIRPMSSHEFLLLLTECAVGNATLLAGVAISNPSPTTIVNCFLNHGKKLLEKFNKELNKDYIESIYGNVRIDREGAYVYKDRDRQWKSLPEIFEKTSFISVEASLPIKNKYRNIITERAYFKLSREIDYDVMTATSNGFSAAIPIDGIGPNRLNQSFQQVFLPNQPSWHQIQSYLYNNDEGQQSFVSFSAMPASWPIKAVLSELAAVCERLSTDIETTQAAIENITERLQEALYDIAISKGYEEVVPEDLNITNIQVIRDTETERYPGPRHCFPCYSVYIETPQGSLYTDSEKIAKKLKNLGQTQGNWAPEVWITDVAKHIDIGDPDFWHDW